jgi:hypothetical protein
MPAWVTSTGVIACHKWVEEKGGLVVELERECHAYYDYQTKKPVQAYFSSVGFVLCSKSVTDDTLRAQSAIFERMRNVIERRRTPKRRRMIHD